MGWLSSFRELRRLAESVKYWRGKADEREKEINRLNALLLSQSLVYADKLLLAVNLQPASWQIRQGGVPPKTVDDILAEKKQEFLTRKLREVEEEAEEAAQHGVTVDARTIYTDRMPEFEAEFARTYLINSNGHNQS